MSCITNANLNKCSQQQLLNFWLGAKKHRARRISIISDVFAHFYQDLFSVFLPPHQNLLWCCCNRSLIKIWKTGSGAPKNKYKEVARGVILDRKCLFFCRIECSDKFFSPQFSPPLPSLYTSSTSLTATGMWKKKSKTQLKQTLDFSPGELTKLCSILCFFNYNVCLNW